MLLAGCEPDHVAGPNLLDRTAPTLRASAACRNDERLTQRVRVPRRPGPRLERDARADRARRVRRFEQWIDADCSGEVLGGTRT